MISKLLFQISSLMILFALASPCLGEMQCDGHDMKHNSTQVQEMKDCLGYHGKASIWQLKTTDFPCFGMCMLKSRSFIGDDGKSIVMDKVMQYIDMVAPEHTKKGLKEMLSKCVKLHGNKIRADEDSKVCMSFMEIGQCFRDAFVDNCVTD